MIDYEKIPDEEINDLVAKNVMNWKDGYEYNTAGKWVVWEYSPIVGHSFPNIQFDKKKWNPVKNMAHCYVVEDRINGDPHLRNKYIWNLRQLCRSFFDCVHADPRTRCIAMLQAVDGDR